MEIRRLEAKRVYDPLLRLLHAWNALAIIGLIVTAWLADLFEHGAREATLWQVHSIVGYALICGLAGRLLWGIIGPRYARLADFFHFDPWREFAHRWRRVDGNGSGGSGIAWRERFRHLRWPQPKRFGHDPMASLAFIALYALLAVQSGLGLALAAIEQNAGPLAPILGDALEWKHFFKEPHEAIYSVVLAFIVAHLSMLVWHQIKGKPVAQAMVNGIQYLERKEPS